MRGSAEKWFPLPDIDQGFGSIRLTYGADTHGSLSVVMNGERSLCLRFMGVVALFLEDECPGTFYAATNLPLLVPKVTFPLLKILGSEWLDQWPMHTGREHFFLISSDDLIHVVARPEVEVAWETFAPAAA